MAPLKDVCGLGLLKAPRSYLSMNTWNTGREADGGDARRDALHEPRHTRHLSQEALGNALGAGQSSVSKLERRADMYLSCVFRPMLTSDSGAS